GLESMTDLNNNKLTIGPGGITHSSGKSVTFTRDALRRITVVTDPAGNSLSYSYNNVTGDLISVRDRENRTTTFEYLAGSYLQTIKDPRDIQPIRNEYDEAGRLRKHIDPFGKEILYDHQIGSRQEIVTDRLGSLTVNEYDDRGNV